MSAPSAPQAADGRQLTWHLGRRMARHPALVGRATGCSAPPLPFASLTGQQQQGQQQQQPPTQSQGGKQLQQPHEGLLPGGAADVFRQGDALYQGRYVLQRKLHDGRFTTLWWGTDKGAPPGTDSLVVLKLMEAGDLASYEATKREAALHAAACTRAAGPAPTAEGASSSAGSRGGAHPAPAMPGTWLGERPLIPGSGGSEPGSGAAHITRLVRSFDHRSACGRHGCMVLEPLGSSLARVLDAYGGGLGAGLAPEAVRSITRQLLLALDHLHREAGILHMSLQPGNVLLDRPFTSMHEVGRAEEAWRAARQAAGRLGRWLSGQQQQLQQQQAESPLERPGCVSELSLDRATVKLTDFGRALDVRQPAQGAGGPPGGLAAQGDPVLVFDLPGYRAPEEVVGLPYETPAYDMWRLGCLVFAMSTGANLFDPAPQPGLGLDLDDAHLAEMTATLGRMPRDMVDASPLSARYFPGRRGRLAVEERGHRIAREPLALVLAREHGYEEEEAESLAAFLQPLLAYHPWERPSAARALQHPWLAGSSGGAGAAGADADADASKGGAGSGQQRRGSK